MKLATANTAILHLICLFSITKTWFPNPVNCLSAETDRLALLEFKSNIVRDPLSNLSSWNDSINLCRWQGVTCGRKHKRVISLDLHGKSLTGTFSPSIKNLTFLRFLNLANNSFHGEIPKEVGHLFRLRELNLTQNILRGEIPLGISNCSNLRVVDFRRNNLTGKLAAQLGSLKKLVTLFLSRNELTGVIPPSFANLSSLQYLDLKINHLQGGIPNDLGKMTSLTSFQVSGNNLTGIIPFALYNLSSLIIFFVAANQLEGSLPANIGLTLPNLVQFGIGGNNFHGIIPISFGNASQLQVLDFSGNKLTGQVPNNLGNLKNLVWLNVANNSLGDNTSRDLDFMTSLSNCSNLKKLHINTNNFGGTLSPTIGNLSAVLGQLYVGLNQISGRIPNEIGNLVGLYILGMEWNQFSGPIPFSFGKLVKLQSLAFSKNMLSGEIPTSFGNITQLYALDLGENNLCGNISNLSVWNCKNLHYLNIADNHLNGPITKQIIANFLQSTDFEVSGNALTGPLPIEVGNMKSIRNLLASDNFLSGEIPDSIGDCLTLEMLGLMNNSFQGSIPLSVASLRGLIALDLSKNNLSGKIPEGIDKLLFLEYLNLSFNNLEGEVPTKGVFSNISRIFLAGNKNLCGGIPELQLPACPAKQKKHRNYATVIILMITTGAVLIFITITSMWVFSRRKPRKTESSVSFMPQKHPQISFEELVQATGGFSIKKIIGEGTFGSVYKGNINLEGERSVAVKVLKLQQHGASKSFLAECKALCNIRHRNLVKLLTYCSSIDYKGNEFKALVYDFLENGSLETWLHPRNAGGNQSRSLSLLQRLRVAIDVSSALHYLEDNCETPIVHCDLKPSNILFDCDMVAHVGDFGLARILPKTTNKYSQDQTSSIGIKGTIGYMAPEYGVGSQATIHGDVYSFGIILLETLTGLRPTEGLFTDGLNLHNFVKAKLPGEVLQVLDPVLISSGDVLISTTTSQAMNDDGNEIREEVVSVERLREDGADAIKCISSVLEIGLACSAELPGDRMSMRDVNRKLNVITEAFLRTRTC